MIKNKLTKLSSVLCTLYSVLPSVLCTLYSVLLITACTEEDLVQPANGETAALRIASVTIDGQQVARTRVVADGGTYDGTYPFNQSYNGFTNGNKLQLVTRGLSGYDSDGSAYSENNFYAIYNADGTWSITVQSDYTTSTPVTLKPAEGKKWADAGIEAAFGGDDVSGTDADVFNNHVAPGLGVVQGDIPVANSIIFSDWLVASTADGSITIDTDVKSPTLGATTIKLKHAHALLRLPVSAANVTAGTYIVNGTAYNVTGLGTLWAVLENSGTTTYCPLTQVTIGEEGDYLQAIVPSSSTDGAYTLTGFKAVMKVDESGEMRDENGEMGDESGNENSPLSTLHSTLTLDLPFTVGTGNSSPESGEVPKAEGSAGSVTLQPNTRYPLTLTIAPTRSTVTLTDPLGKPGWGTDEEELSNEMNELLITVDGTQYIKLDGTVTNMEKVKSIIETATAAGYTNFYVTGETLAAYSNGTAKTVVGEAIRLLAEGTTVSLLLPEATSIAQSAFTVCKALASVSAPEATVIHTAAFGGCTSLASVEFPNANTIMASAFGDCAALTSVEFPLVNQIGNQAFGGCASLTSVEFPLVNQIGNQAFGGCASLTSLTLGKVTTVQNGAFLNASTTTCDLTLVSGSTGNPEAGENKQWAGKTWKSITLISTNE